MYGSIHHRCCAMFCYQLCAQHCAPQCTLYTKDANVAAHCVAAVKRLVIRMPLQPCTLHKRDQCTVCADVTSNACKSDVGPRDLPWVPLAHCRHCLQPRSGRTASNSSFGLAYQQVCACWHASQAYHTHFAIVLPKHCQRLPMGDPLVYSRHAGCRAHRWHPRRCKHCGSGSCNLSNRVLMVPGLLFTRNRRQKGGGGGLLHCRSEYVRT